MTVASRKRCLPLPCLTGYRATEPKATWKGIPSGGTCKIRAVWLGDHGTPRLIGVVAEDQRQCTFTPPYFEATLRCHEQAARAWRATSNTEVGIRSYTVFDDAINKLYKAANRLADPEMNYLIRHFERLEANILSEIAPDQMESELIGELESAT